MSRKKWNVELSKSSLKYLERLGKDSMARIMDSLEELERGENPLVHRDVRPLEGKFKGFFRLRVGDFRLIFELDRQNKRIGILAIVPRGNAY